MLDVTVVVPTHNRSDLLRTTLRSLLGQRDVQFDVVVVDDGSTDATEAVVASFDDERLRLVTNPVAQGVSRARNRGIQAATGEWVGFCDDDDVWAPDKLSGQLSAARVADCAWAYSGVVNVDEELHPLSLPPLPTPQEVVRGLGRFNAVPGGGSNVIVRRDLLAAVGPFDVHLRNTEDWEMWLRLSRRSSPAVATQRTVGYRVHASNASLSVSDILDGVRRIESLHGTRADRGVIHRWLAESSLRQGHRASAVRHWAVAASRGQGGAVLADVRAVVARRLPGHRARSGSGDARDPEPHGTQWLELLAGQGCEQELS